MKSISQIKNFFSVIYNKILIIARHPAAPYYLAILSFVESFILPLTPLILLIPMVLAKPKAAWRYAGICSIASVFGGLLGYIIGHYFIKEFHPYLIQLGYDESFQQIVVWLYNHTNFGFMVLAALSPLPFKFFSLAAGIVDLPFISFVLASILGRFLHFYIVSAILLIGGKLLYKKIEGHSRKLLILFLLALIVTYFVYH